MADIQAEKTKQEQFLDRLKERYPDKEYADDEALYGQINDDYDAYDGKIKSYEDEIGKYKEKDSKLNDLFAKDPKNAQFITDMAKGNDPFIAVITRLGIDGITDLLNDPEKQDEYAEANAQYLERVAQEQKLTEEYNANMDASLATLEKVQNEMGIADDVIDSAFELIMKIANEAVVGKFSEDTIKMALKAINHDADVQNANAEGEIKGKNTKIKETLRKPSMGDGTSPLAGSNNNPAPKRKNNSIFSLADEA